MVSSSISNCPQQISKLHARRPPNCPPIPTPIKTPAYICYIWKYLNPGGQSPVEIDPDTNL